MQRKRKQQKYLTQIKKFFSESIAMFPLLLHLQTSRLQERNRDPSYHYINKTMIIRVVCSSGYFLGNTTQDATSRTAALKVHGSVGKAL
jgi:hypothetical protein